MIRDLSRLLLASFALLGLALAAPLAAAAQQGTVAGRVVEDPGERPIANAVVMVVRTNRSAITDVDGRYRIGGVPVGEARVRVAIIGYASQERTVTVAASETASADFRLGRAAVSLDAVVATAVGQQRAAEIANAITTIDAARVVDEQSVQDLADLLQARAPGVNVLPSTGTTGLGTRIRIRGANSVSLSNEPLVLVDGIRVHSSSSSYSLYIGSQEPSRINDLNPEEIRSVEVVKGPSAAALYGTQAANGVILITTKRGTAGETRWTAYTEQGVLSDVADYPSNYTGLTAAGSSCTLVAEAGGSCTQASLATFNPLENPVTSPFGSGHRQQYGLSVSGGTERVNYFVSSEFEGERGIYEMPQRDQEDLLQRSGRTELRDDELRPNYLRKVSLRANLSARVTETADVSVSAGYVSSNLRLPQNDNNILGILSNAYTGRGDTTALGPWGFGFGMGETFQVFSDQEIERFTGSLQGNWRPTSFLSGRLTAGLDVTQRMDGDLQRFGEGPPFLQFDLGFVDDNRFQIFSYTLDAGGTASFQLTPRISSKTSVGVQYYKDFFNGTFTFGEFLIPGGNTLDFATNTQVGETTTETVTLGTFVEEVIGLNDRLFLTGAVRVDQNSTFGADFGRAAYPKAAVSWLLSDEPFFPGIGPLNLLRLRVAYGQSGLQPGANDAVRFLTPVTASVDGGDATGVTLAGLGNADLKPERSREVELGFDASFLDQRVGLEVTYYNKKTTDALISVPTPPSIGFPTSRVENVGSVRNSGVEVVLNLRPVSTEKVSWDVTLSGATNSNELLKLNDTIPIILNAGRQRHAIGFPLGGYWAIPIESFSDADGDGIIEASEVTTGSSVKYLGPSIPTKEFTLNTGVTLFSNRLRLGAQLDYRGGHKLWNLTEEFRCRAAGQSCRGLNDRDAGLSEQARVVALRFVPLAQRTNAGYIEDASFVKLREVSATYTVPERIVQQLRVKRLSVSLTARNLATWSDYSGVDPEVNGQGQSNFFIRDFLTQPPVRYVTARVNVGF